MLATPLSNTQSVAVNCEPCRTSSCAPTRAVDDEKFTRRSCKVPARVRVSRMLPRSEHSRHTWIPMALSAMTMPLPFVRPTFVRLRKKAITE